MALIESGPRSLQRLETIGAAAVIAAGVMLHFAYNLSGRSYLVAVFAPANESVWEHLKLVVVPVDALCLVETIWVADRQRLWLAKLVEVLAACAFIVAFFYTYTGALGIGSFVAVDIMSFFVAVAGGQWLSYRMLVSPGRRQVPLWLSVVALLLVAVGFAVLTFAPPHVPLFQETSTGSYGPA